MLEKRKPLMVMVSSAVMIYLLYQMGSLQVLENGPLDLLSTRVL